MRRWHGSDEPQFDRAQAMRIARIAVDNPAVRVEPEDAPGHTVEAMRRRLALAVRDELERRKRQTALMTYDDLLTRLDDTLKGPGGEAAAKRLRERYRVVLVDEFQDTDPVQWDIMRRAFGDGDTTLVLIGDPKQAIYAFRGADVYAYLEAARPGRHARDARGQLAQRPGPHRRLRRAARAARSSGTRASSTAGSGPRTPTRRRASTTRPSPRRCASGSSIATSRR